MNPARSLPSHRPNILPACSLDTQQKTFYSLQRRADKVAIYRPRWLSLATICQMDLNENAKLWVWFGSPDGRGGGVGWRKKNHLTAAFWTVLLARLCYPAVLTGLSYLGATGRRWWCLLRSRYQTKGSLGMHRGAHI